MNRGLEQAGKYKPGHGHLNLYGYLKPDAAGGALDYAHRINESMSAFAQGWGGVAKDPFGNWQRDFGALGGLRWQW